MGRSMSRRAFLGLMVAAGCTATLAGCGSKNEHEGFSDRMYELAQAIMETYGSYLDLNITIDEAAESLDENITSLNSLFKSIESEEPEEYYPGLKFAIFATGAYSYIAFERYEDALYGSTPDWFSTSDIKSDYEVMQNIMDGKYSIEELAALESQCGTVLKANGKV